MFVGKAAGDGADSKMVENDSELEQVLSRWKGELFCYVMFHSICSSYDCLISKILIYFCYISMALNGFYVLMCH